jgi:hypothetical protein
VLQRYQEAVNPIETEEDILRGLNATSKWQTKDERCAAAVATERRRTMRPGYRHG